MEDENFSVLMQDLQVSKLRNLSREKLMIVRYQTEDGSVINWPPGSGSVILSYGPVEQEERKEEEEGRTPAGDPCLAGKGNREEVGGKAMPLLLRIGRESGML